MTRLRGRQVQVSCAAVGLVFAGSASAQTLWPTAGAAGPALTFLDDRTGYPNRYAVGHDGRLTALGDHPPEVAEPDWSPDGALIAAAGGTRGEIFLMNADGADVRRLLSTAADPKHTDSAPRWRPDGAELAFVRFKDASPGYGSSVWLVRRNGTGLRRVVRRGWMPAWWPDGRSLVLYGDCGLMRVWPVSGRTRCLYASGAPGAGALVTPYDVAAPDVAPDGRVAFVVRVQTGPANMGGGKRRHVAVRLPSGQVRIVPGTLGAVGARWSPDGRTLAVSVRRPMRIGVFLHGAGAPQRLTRGLVPTGTASWSPDGRRLVALLATRRNDTVQDVLFDDRLSVIGADGSGRSLLGPSSPDDAPVWSPDGSRFAYADDGGIYVGSAGEAARPLTGRSLRAYGPVWSPDGTRLAFTSVPWADVGLFEERRRVTVQAVDGGAPVEVAAPRNPWKGVSETYDPAWSPDGTLIAYTGSPNGICGGDVCSIYVAPADGSGTPRAFGQGELPAWSPDGSRIAFSLQPDLSDGKLRNRPGLWLVNADGTGRRRLPGGTILDAAPAWSPDGTDLAYSTSSTYATSHLGGDRAGEIWLTRPDGSDRRRLTTTAQDERDPRWLFVP